MTSGNFHRVPLNQIIVNREERQRRDLIDIPELAESIGRLGLIHPIVITRDNVLVAGERRFEAHKYLNLPDIQCQYTDELDPLALHAIELEENIKRAALTWQDEVRAIDEYHKLKLKMEPDWHQAATAAALGLDAGTITKKLAVAEEIAKGNELVVKAPKYSVAQGITERSRARASDSALAEIKRAYTVKEPSDESQTILCKDFVEWSDAFDGPRFNFIHWDPPYGIGANTFNQGSATLHGGYEDSAETYFSLLRVFARNYRKFTTDSAHIMLWFSMRYYQETLDFFAKETDFKLDPFPLIWTKSDNIGILPDPSRGPRRIYETALFGSRGDRLIVRSKSNSYAAPSVRTQHMSEKNEAMLRHFMGMFVDEHSSVLDPTCGSGSALRAAASLGAAHVLGLEINPEFAALAEIAFRRAEQLRKAS